MTLMAKETIPCPACGLEQEIEVYQTINADITPELVDRLFDGKINVFNCTSCGHRAFVNQPLLFNDMRKEQKIQYFPVDWLNAIIESGRLDDGFSGYLLFPPDRKPRPQLLILPKSMHNIF
jgi:transcription elongation factor Elf1